MGFPIEILMPKSCNTEVLKRKLKAMIVGARSLVWIRHQPSELGIPGSNPGAPATHYSFFSISPKTARNPIKNTSPKGTEMIIKPIESITHIGSPIPSSGCISITYQNRNEVAKFQTIQLLNISNSPLCHCFKLTYPSVPWHEST